MGQPMGLGPIATACFKRKFRWTLSIPEVTSATATSSANVLAPNKAARPSLSFKTIDVQHLNETIYYPGKPDWKPVSITLYDTKTKSGDNPVFEWVKKFYDPQEGTWRADRVNNYKRTAILKMLDGCGGTLESWRFINAWPESIEFGDLDYGSSEYVTVDITLRYDRAFQT